MFHHLFESNNILQQFFDGRLWHLEYLSYLYQFSFLQIL